MPALYTIDPDRPLAPLIEKAKEATFIPVDRLTNPKRGLLGGILRANRSFVQNSASYIDEYRNPTHKPSPQLMEGAEVRPGNWLFGGRYDLRFGHFLVESVSRLWALDYIGLPVHGVVYMQASPRRWPNPKRLIAKGRHLYDLFEGLPEPELIVRPTRFETLYVPPQGCGAGQLAAGCPEFRKFARRRFSTAIVPSGADRLYISRNNLKQTPGQIVNEQLLETALLEDGFDVFHPEEHTLNEQIARIKAAKIIVGVEGSAFHLVAYAANLDCKIGAIRRRKKNHGIISHCRAFHGSRVTDINAIVSEFIAEGSRYNIGNAVLEFSVLADQLKENGLVGKNFSLSKLSQTEVEMGIKALNDRIQGVDD